MKTYPYRQAGLTLLEFSIALLLMSAMVGVVFEGYSLSDRATVKTLIAEMNDVKTMLYTYRSIYKAIPGDDIRAPEHLPGGLAPGTNYPGNNYINNAGYYSWADPTLDVANESGLFWQHVRLAGLAEGDPASRVAHNAVGGQIGITSNTYDVPVVPAGSTRLYYVCSGAITGRLARMIDIQLDDGDATTGRVWASAETNVLPVTTSKANTPYDDANTYTVCTSFS